MSRPLMHDKSFRCVLFLAGVLAGMILAAPACAGAPAYTFTTIDPPGSIGTDAFGINNAGAIVGNFGTGGPSHGFLATGGHFTTIDVPGSTFTQVIGINNAGQMVGTFGDAAGQLHGFLATGGRFTTVDVPGSTSTFPFGINDMGQIVGQFYEGLGGPGQRHGFLYSGGSFRTIDIPGSPITFVFGINNAGQLVGGFTDAATARTRGFLLTGGSVITLDIPGSEWTTAYGINSAGDVAGAFFGVFRGTGAHGFVYRGGSFQTIDVPGSITNTRVFGINDAGQLVGDFGDATGGHGFLATPVPTPFAAFTATLELKFGPRIDDTFTLQSTITLPPGSDALDLSHDAVTLTLTHEAASFTTTIPAGAFTTDKRDRFTFKGTIDGVKLDATLTSLGNNVATFTMDGKHADLSGLAHPVTVTLTIGGERGSATATADGKQARTR
jgi:probable HAF family extracellular repeat protein